MPRKRQYKEIDCRFFRWKLFRRDGIYYADGRSNNGAVKLGRYSLEATTEREAREALQQLDTVKAVETGRAARSTLADDQGQSLPIDEGVKRYLDHVGRPPVLGGASKSTAKRYRAVFDKFAPFLKRQGVHDWRAVTKAHVQAYGRWLEDEEEYEYATEYIELTTIKQALNWMIGEGMIPASCKFSLPLKKPVGTTTYCYEPAEVAAMLAHCQSTPALAWLADVIVALAHTGLRISELAGLRWSDVDDELTRITLVDESRRGGRAHRAVARTTKTHRDRTLPVHARLREVLERLPHHPDGRVFHGPNGGRLKPDTLRNILIRDVLEPLAKRFPAKTGQQGLEDGRLHSFRHYFASMAASSGAVDAETLMTWLGHTDSKMVRHYFHLFEDRAGKQMQKIEFVAGPAAASAAGEATHTGTETAQAKGKNNARKSA